MATTQPTPVKDLHLDLTNFRTVKQKNEINAVNAMISIHSDSFWALMDSLIEDGFLPTENIIVIKDAKQDLIVKEGNRRIGCMKLILGFLDRKKFNIPSDLLEKIHNLPDSWTSENQKVPCAVYEAKEEKIVDKIVSLTHGKGQKAGRIGWESVAKARHNRDVLKASEDGLDLLEKYLAHGSNLTGQQKDRWAGVYHLTVLNDALPKVFPRLGLDSVKSMVKGYPNSKFKDAIEELLRLIGIETVGFTEIRSEDFDSLLVGIGFPKLQKQKDPDPKPGKKGKGPKPKKKGASTPPIDDPKAVRNQLKLFNPTGPNSQKVATLKDEALALNLDKNPIAFCFLLRSMFEISSKIYCDRHTISLKKTAKNGQVYDRTLLEVLKEVTNHLTNKGKDKSMVQQLHGAIAELGKSEGLLSVTSMNQLVHNRTFVVTTSEICTLFARVYPLLEYMN